MRHQEPLLTEGSYELILAEEEHILPIFAKQQMNVGWWQ